MSPQVMFIVLAIVAVLYLIFAIYHHQKDKTLKLEVIIEYFLIAALSLLIFSGLLI